MGIWSLYVCITAIIAIFFHKYYDYIFRYVKCNLIIYKPEIWGPHGWIFLHTITFNYPEKPTKEDKFYHKELFNNLKYTLPCKSCANHYSLNLVKYPLEPALESRTKLINWLIDIHNEVNKKNCKRVYSYEEVSNYIIICMMLKKLITLFNNSCH